MILSFNVSMSFEEHWMLKDIAIKEMVICDKCKNILRKECVLSCFLFSIDF